MSYPDFHTTTPLARGLKALFQRTEKDLALSRPLNVYLYGGMAVHLYTASRVTTNVNIAFESPLFIPRDLHDLSAKVTLDDGTRTALHFNTTYTSEFVLRHKDYQKNAIPVDLDMDAIRLHVFTPCDLVVSKIARLNGLDMSDIIDLVRSGLASSGDIERRATEALSEYAGLRGYEGDLALLRFNLRDTLILARETEAERDALAQSIIHPE